MAAVVLSLLLELAGRVLVEAALVTAGARTVPVEAGLLEAHLGAVALGLAEALHVLVLVVAVESLAALVKSLRALLVAVLVSALRVVVSNAADRNAADRSADRSTAVVGTAQRRAHASVLVAVQQTADQAGPATADLVQQLA